MPGLLPCTFFIPNFSFLFDKYPFFDKSVHFVNTKLILCLINYVFLLVYGVFLMFHVSLVRFHVLINQGNVQERQAAVALKRAKTVQLVATAMVED